ncbi:hypothetical protein P3S68_005287 [Capsicum galapagoense]
MDSSENWRTQLTLSHTGGENEIAGVDNGEEEHNSSKRRSSSKATRRARQIYVGGLPPTANVQTWWLCTSIMLCRQLVETLLVQEILSLMFI